MSKALSDLEDFFDGMVGDDPGFDVVAGAIEYILLLQEDKKELFEVIEESSKVIDGMAILVWDWDHRND